MRERISSKPQQIIDGFVENDHHHFEAHISDYTSCLKYVIVAMLFLSKNSRTPYEFLVIYIYISCYMYTLQILIVILLYESIKVMEKMYILMIGKLFCKNYH